MTVASPPFRSRFLQPIFACVAFAWANATVADPAGPLPPLADQQIAHSIFRELIEIDTTHSQGSTRAAVLLQQRFLAAGFEVRDITFIAPPDHPTKGNLVVRYRGKGVARPILFVGHLDVVVADPANWTVDPFKLTQQDGWFYGRGTIDMKNADAALAECLIRLKRKHFVPDRDIIVAFTADEEAGGDSNGPAFLLGAHRDLIDAELAVNLDSGSSGIYRDGRRLYFTVGTSQKIYATFTLETTSPGGHGALPGPDNAIYHLARGLSRIESYAFPIHLTTTTRATFATLANVVPGPRSADMRTISSESDDAVAVAAAAQRLSETVAYNAQLRTICVATLISGGEAENALPERARATIQCRVIPGDSVEFVQAALTTVLDDEKVQITLDGAPVISPDSPLTPSMLAKVGSVVHSMWPGVPIMPTMSVGFSDDRELRKAGIASYDLSGIWKDLNENRSHGRDERVGVREFNESIEYTYRLLKEMSRAN